MAIFSNQNQINVFQAADQGGSSGKGLNATSFVEGLIWDTLAESVREEIVDKLDPKAAKRFPPTEELKKAMLLIVPEETLAAKDSYTIANEICQAIRQVRGNAKSAGEAFLTNSVALDVVIRSIPLLDATELTSNSGASRIEKLRHLCQEQESFRARVGYFNAQRESNGAETTTDNSSDTQPISTSETTNNQNNTNSTALSNQIGSMFDLAGVSADDRPDLETRITNLVNARKIYEEDLENMRMIASPDIRDVEPPPMSSVVALLEEGINLPSISLAIQLRSKLQTDADLNMAELLSDEEMSKMTDKNFEKTIFSPKNLPVETLQDFCDEFNFDVDLAAGTGDLGENYDLGTEAAEEIAEALVRAIRAGEGNTIEARVRSIVNLSRERRELNGNFDMLMTLIGE